MAFSYMAEDWESLTRTISTYCIPSILAGAIPAGKKILSKHVQKDLYGAYTPKNGGWVGGETYQRRMSLIDESRYISVFDYIDNEVTITSVAEPSPPIVDGSVFHPEDYGAFLQMHEVGHMGIFRAYFPRPVISRTQEEFDRNIQAHGTIARAIEKGIHTEIET